TGLAHATTYAVRITTSARDLAGNALPAAYTWSFSTGNAPDTTPPIVSATSPAEGASGVAVNAALAATFSEAMVAGSLTAATFTLTGPGGAVAGDFPVNAALAVTFSEPMDPQTITTASLLLAAKDPVVGTVTYSGTTATFTPAASLDFATTYVAMVTTSATDLAGNPLSSDH